MSDEFAARKADKFRYRYPSGESYSDVIQRLEPVIVEIERQRDPVVVVGHQAVLRALYGYFQGIPQDECPHLNIPLHTVIELRPVESGYEEERFQLLDRGEAPRFSQAAPARDAG
jgi:6-phosphofructo-2-kinase/fructose-2,6-biphosphatase